MSAEQKECMKHLAVWTMIIIGCALVWVAILSLVTPATAKAQEQPTPPQGEVLGMLFFPGTATPTNVTYYDTDTQQIVSEVFHAPDVNYIDGRCVKPVSEAQFAAQGETFEDLPTFALAKWHWWLFGFVLLPEAQKQYSDCVGQIKAWQKIYNVYPLIDDPAHPLYPIILAIRQYQVPFVNFQNLFGSTNPELPPTHFDAIVDARAAVDSYNVTVYNFNLCQDTLASLGLPKDCN